MPIWQLLLSYWLISFLTKAANSFSSNSADSYDICLSKLLSYKYWNIEINDFEYLNIGFSNLAIQ